MRLAENILKSIIQFGIEGKLTEGMFTDIDSSEELLQIISKNKTKISNKEARKYPFNGLPEKLPFEIPEHWTWTTLSQLYTSKDLNDGDWILSKNMDENGEIKLIQLGNIGYGKYFEKEYKRITEDAYKELNCTEIKPGYLLFNRIIGGGIYSCIIPKIDGKLITSVDAMWIAPTSNIDNEYLMYLFLSGYMFNKINDLKAGTTRVRISKGNLINIPIPLPPLKEQKKIVEKIVEVLPVIKALEKEENLLLDLDERLPARLRKSILQSAMEGKLTEQIETEQTGKDVLNEAIKTKEELIKNKIVRRVRVPEVVEEDIPFDIPESWTWGYIEDVSYSVSPRKYQIKSSEIEKEGRYPVVSQSKDFIDGYYSDESKLFKSESPTIVFGDHNKTVKFIDFDFVVGADGTKLLKSIINPHYYYYVILYIVQGLDTKNYGRHYNLLTKEPIPIPPLEEQQRIVDKLDQLFAEIDLLESNE